MNLGIEPSTVPFNTSLFHTPGINAVARAGRDHVHSPVSFPKKHKCFACCLAWDFVAPSQLAHGFALEAVPGSKVSC